MVQKISIQRDGILQNVESVISVQEASDIFGGPDKKDFGIGYIEQDLSAKKSTEIYDKMNNELLGNGEFNEGDFLEFNEKMSIIFELVDRDNEFTDCMREFLSLSSHCRLSRIYALLKDENSPSFYPRDRNIGTV